MQRAVLVSLIALMLVGLAVRSLQSPVEFVLYGLLVVVFAVAGAGLLAEAAARRTAPDDPVHRLAALALGVWLLAGLAVTWGLLRSALAGDGMYVSLSWGARLVPLALFPAFAFAIRSREGWFRLLLGMVLLGTVSALIDIGEWLRGGETVFRLMSADFASIDYFYGLIAALTLLLLVPLDRVIRLALIAALPVLGVRMVLAVARAWYVIVALVVVYCAVVAWRWLPDARRRLVLLAGGALLAGVVLAAFGRLGPTPTAYLDAYAARFSVLDVSLHYRWSEIARAFTYGGVLGAGWGARGDFEDALLFTSSSYYFAVKPYVHNFVAFMFWKLGVVGLLLLALLGGYLARQALVTVRQRDALGFVVLGLWLAWLVHSLVNMNFGRPELNVWAAAWLGYFLRRSLWATAARPAPVPAPREVERAVRPAPGLGA